jgi:hypothetical protein
MTSVLYGPVTAPSDRARRRRSGSDSTGSLTTQPTPARRLSRSGAAAQPGRRRPATNSAGTRCAGWLTGSAECLLGRAATAAQRAHSFRR